MRARLSAFILSFAIVAVPAGATTTCDTVAACIMGTNSAAGSGVAGVSKSGHGVSGSSSSGFGVVGITKENATSTGNARTGVWGEDVSTNKNAYNSGVVGTSSYGFGVTGQSAFGVGVSGAGSTGGAFTTETSGTALVSLAQQGIGANLSGYVVGAVFNSYEQGVTVQSYNGPGLVTSGGIGYLEGGDGVDAASQETALHAYANDGPVVGSALGNANILVGTTLAGKTVGGPQTSTDVVTIDSGGNAVFAGSVTMHGSPSVRMKSSTGADVATFVNRTSTATMEDMGGASLVNGAAYVAIDPGFASLVDQHTKYLVFLTPQGDSRGLYVTQLTAKGFAVRESAGGRSSLAFDYRIVAKPLGEKAQRLPTVTTLPQLANRAPMPDFAKMRANLRKTFKLER